MEIEALYKQLSHLDDLLVRLIINLDCRDGLFHLPQDHVQVLIICLRRYKLTVTGLQKKSKFVPFRLSLARRLVVSLLTQVALMLCSTWRFLGAE